jgi:hypothetical protein
MEWFSVYLQARALDYYITKDTQHIMPDDTAVAKFMDLVEPDHGIVAVGPGSWEATISIKTIMPATAATVGGAIIQERASRAGMPDWPIVRIEAVRHDVLDEELSAEEREESVQYE